MSVLGILIVDDNPDHRFLARKTLSQDGGYQVETAASGVEALEKIKEKTFALVLLDYNMPGMNGQEVLKHILAKDPQATVVMLTGGGSESVAVELIKAGASDYIIKTDDYLTQLPAIVDRAFQRRKLAEKERELAQERIKLTKFSAIVETAIAVNHEVNNPLFAIQASAQILKQRIIPGDSRTQRPINTILESCERISQVTRKLASMVDPASKSYAGGASMLDLCTTPVPGDSIGSSVDESDQTPDYMPILWQVSNVLSSSLDLDHVLRELAISIVRLLKGTWCSIGLMENSDRLRLHVRCDSGPNENIQIDTDKRRQYSLADFEFIRRAAVANEPILIESPDDPRIGPEGRRIILGYGLTSVVIAPICHQENLLGILFIGRADRALNNQEMALCRLIANQASFAIHNAIQHTTLKERTDQLKALIEGWSAANSALDLNQRLEIFVRRISEMMGSDYAVIRFLEEDMLVPGAGIGPGGDPLKRTPISAGKGLGGLVLNSEEPVIVEDFINDPREYVRYAVDDAHREIYSYIGIRLVARGRILGIFGVFAPRNRHFSPEEIQTFVTIADQISLSIDDARLLWESKARADELAEKAEYIRMKNEIVQAILASNRIEDVCDVVVRNASKLIPCDCACVTLVDWENEVHHIIACNGGSDFPIKSGNKMRFSETMLSDMFLNLKPITVDDYLKIENPTKFSQELINNKVRSALFVPVVFGERFLGALAFSSFEPSQFHTGMLTIAQELADQTAVAIQNALLLETISISKAEWEATFDAITDSVWVQTPECLVVKANKTASEAVNIPLSDLVGKKCCRSLHGKKLPCEECPVSMARMAREPISKEYQGTGDNTYLASAYPIFGEGNKLLAVVFHEKDITEQKRVEQQLMHSKKLAAVGELAAGVAHNFNNLLAGVRGAIELLQMQADREQFSPKVTARLQTIKERLDQGDAIIGRLLSFARGSSESPSEIDLNSSVRSALAICETHQDGKGLEIRVDLEPELPLASGVDSHLQQVLVNMIINAFQATEPGGAITLKTALSSKKGFMDITVRDTGCGIAEENLQRIFEPFFTKRHRGGGGTGLGLSASRTMVEAMGGTLRVESEVGKGTAFTITLPIHVESKDSLEATSNI